MVENGTTSTFAVASITAGHININESTSSANDTVNVVNDMGFPVTVNEGNGTDVVNISPTSNNLDYIQGYVNVIGGSGFDTLNVNDLGDPHTGSANTYTMTGSYAQRTGAAFIFYSGIEVETVNGSASGGTYNVQGTELSGTTNLIAGGTSTVSVGNNHTVSAIQGMLNISNPPNYNTINVDDSADTANRVITLNTETPGWARSSACRPRSTTSTPTPAA